LTEREALFLIVWIVCMEKLTLYGDIYICTLSTEGNKKKRETEREKSMIISFF